MCPDTRMVDGRIIKCPDSKDGGIRTIKWPVASVSPLAIFQLLLHHSANCCSYFGTINLQPPSLCFWGVNFSVMPCWLWELHSMAGIAVCHEYGICH